MAKKKDIALDQNAEEKIKAAAKKLFTEKGFSAVKTRDIAAEADINLALLNYYFRSKQKLYELIMEENVRDFKKGIGELLLKEEDEDVFVTIEKMASYYIDTLLENPYLALFIVNEIQQNKANILSSEKDPFSKKRQQFVQAFYAKLQSQKIIPFHPIHLMSNIIGLIVMPFLAKPVLIHRMKIKDQIFIEEMQARKKLIPQWIKAMLIPVK